MARTNFNDGAKGDTSWQPGIEANGAPRRVADPSKDFIEGHIMKVKENIGKNNARVYQISISPDPKVPYTGFSTEGTLVDLWGCTVLDDQMDDFMKSPIGGLGAWVRIEFSGRKPKKEAQGKAEGALAPSDLTIFYTVIGDDEIPRTKVDGATPYVAATNNVAPAPVTQKETAPVTEIPASIDETGDDPESDDLPF